jgi:hypothetical protein
MSESLLNRGNGRDPSHVFERHLFFPYHLHGMGAAKVSLMQLMHQGRSEFAVISLIMISAGLVLPMVMENI